MKPKPGGKTGLAGRLCISSEHVITQTGEIDDNLFDWNSVLEHNLPAFAEPSVQFGVVPHPNLSSAVLGKRPKGKIHAKSALFGGQFATQQASIGRGKSLAIVSQSLSRTEKE